MSQEQNKMEPSVSIHHFVHPAWFEELGGWTVEANIELFMNFAVEAFKRFGKHAKLWSSFNEPTVSSKLHACTCAHQDHTHTVCSCPCAANGVAFTTDQRSTLSAVDACVCTVYMFDSTSHASKSTCSHKRNQIWFFS